MVRGLTQRAFTFIGIRRMVKALTKVEADVRFKIAREVAQERAEELASRMRINAPTEEIRNKIKVVASKNRSPVRVGYNAMLSARDFKPDFFWPAIIEFGSRTRSPRPFMRPAFDFLKEGLKLKFQTEVVRKLEQSVAIHRVIR